MPSVDRAILPFGRIIDIHAHILPGVDDGAGDWKEARWMLSCAYRQGIHTIIATPHYSHRQDVVQLRQFASQLDMEAKRIAPDFSIFLGQEILYFDSIVECLQAGHALTMAGSRYVLVEFMPDISFSRMYQAVRKLLVAGYHPILAHVERYSAMRDEEQMQEMIRAGCYLQMNYKSIQGGLFDHNVRRCRRLVKERQIHFLATDMHGKDHRTPEISKSLRWLAGHVDESHVSYMLEKNAQQLFTEWRKS